MKQLKINRLRTCSSRREGIDGHNLLHGQVFAVGALELDLEVSEGINEEHIILGEINHGSEPLNEFHGRVMVAAVDILVEEQEILDEQDVDILQRHVRHGILVFDKLFDPAPGQLIAPVYFQLGVELADGLIDGNACNNWRFSGLFDRVSLHIEEYLERVFHNLIL